MVSTAEIEFFCARGHVTRVTFSAKALFDVPATWECEVCHLTATRIPPDVKSVDTRVSSTSIPEGGAASSSDTEADKTSQADDASHSGDTIQPDGMSQPEDGPATVRSTDTPSGICWTRRHDEARLNAKRSCAPPSNAFNSSSWDVHAVMPSRNLDNSA